MSYRREDAAFPAGWLYDRLSDHYSGGQVFKDVDSIELGDDFVAKITSAVGSCDVLLALIGDKWLTITDEDGRRRLDDTDDFVRLEIEAALKRNVLVIPILVGGARMPRAGDVPASLAKLATRQALELSPSRFDFDLSRLLKVLDRTLAKVQEQEREIPEQRTRDDEDERTQAWLRLQLEEMEERERRPPEDVLARPVHAELHPVRARARAAARYELRVSNPNAAPARLSIRPGLASSSLRIAVERSRHEIEPGGTAVTAVSVRPSWPVLVRRQHEHTFSLDLATEGAPASGVQGTLVQERRVPLWSVALLLPVLAFLIVRWLVDAPLQDTVLFVRGGAIWKVNPTTQEAERVAQVNADGFAPSVSPDGERIAFGRGQEGENDDVWVMDADGSNQVNLTPDSPESDDASPSWSPDGSKIVFHSDREDGNYDIYWMLSSVGGPPPKPLTFGGPQEKHPEWSPDGRWIAFESSQNDDSEDGPFDIYRITPYGDKRERLTEFIEDDGVPAWSPDSRQIVFRSEHEGDYEVWKMDAEGSDEKQVTDGYAIVRAPAWSPEGGRVVFASGSGENFDLYVVDAEGGDPIPLLQSGDDNRGPTWCCFESSSG